MATLDQALHESVSLRFIRVDTVLKGSHILYFNVLELNFQEAEVEPNPSPKQGTAIHPRLERTRLSGSLLVKVHLAHHVMCVYSVAGATAA
jgi:hypothetical protein